MKRVNLKDKVIQRSIGFRGRQIEFFDKYPNFKPDEFCRLAIDEQIKIIDESFLSQENE